MLITQSMQLFLNKSTLLAKPLLLASIITAGLLLISSCASLGTSLKDEADWTAKEYYDTARSALENEQWETAIKHYEGLKSSYPYGKFAEQAYLDLAYAYYRFDEPNSAIAEIEEFTRLYPKHQKIEYAFFLRALAAESMNKGVLDGILTDPSKRQVSSVRDAYNYYASLIKRFPESQYRAEAEKRMLTMRNQLAAHEVDVAEFYQLRDAWLAAANRAAYVIEYYPRSKSVPKALKILAKSYEAMGMKQQAADTLKVLKLNYPDQLAPDSQL